MRVQEVHTIPYGSTRKIYEIDGLRVYDTFFKKGAYFTTTIYYIHNESVFGYSYSYKWCNDEVDRVEKKVKRKLWEKIKREVKK